LAGPIDVTKLANAKTEAEADAAAAELNAQINGRAGQPPGAQPPGMQPAALASKIGPGPGGQNGDPDSLPPPLRRVAIIDEIRGICVLCMVCFHCFFLLGSQFEVAWGTNLYEFFKPAQPAFSALFILISGICTRFSRNVKKRGFLLAIIAAGISLITVLLLPYLGFQDMRVWFGVLHLLAVSTLLFSFGRKIFDKIPSFVGLVFCLALFFLFAPVSQGYIGMFGFRHELRDSLYQSNALAFLGFHTPEFEAFDHFPLLPYMFIFLFGAFMGAIIRPTSRIWYTGRGRAGWLDEGLPEFCYRSHSTFFGLLGRYALPIYLLHVPVFYGLVYFIQAIGSLGR